MFPVPYVLIIFTAFLGFLIAFHLQQKKHGKKPFVCPLKARCDIVVNSNYACFFGIPVEFLGMFYYAVIAAGYGATFIWPEYTNSHVYFFLFLLSGMAFLFSAYLIFIQGVVIRHWCTCCIGSASLCTIIFLLALFGTQIDLVAMMALYHKPILVLHLLGFCLGLGGATMTDLFFFKFLKDLRISEFEAYILQTLSQVIWFGLALLLISGLGLYLPNSELLNHSSKFLLKMTAVLVIIINGSFLNIVVAPKLVKITFGKRHDHEEGELHHLRKLAFAMGAFSVISWYSALILAFMPHVAISYMTLFSIYLALLVLGIVASQFTERYFANQD